MKDLACSQATSRCYVGILLGRAVEGIVCFYVVIRLPFAAIPAAIWYRISNTKHVAFSHGCLVTRLLQPLFFLFTKEWAHARSVRANNMVLMLICWWVWLEKIENVREGPRYLVLIPKLELFRGKNSRRSAPRWGGLAELGAGYWPRFDATYTTLRSALLPLIAEKEELMQDIHKPEASLEPLCWNRRTVQAMGTRYHTCLTLLARLNEQLWVLSF